MHSKFLNDTTPKGYIQAWDTFYIVIVTEHLQLLRASHGSQFWVVPGLVNDQRFCDFSDAATTWKRECSIKGEKKSLLRKSTGKFQSVDAQKECGLKANRTIANRTMISRSKNHVY